MGLIPAMSKYIVRGDIKCGCYGVEAIRGVDPETAAALDEELDRQQNKLILIASENYASEAVLAAQGCIMTNKYAEGYPGKRYYNGCQFVDVAERLAIDRACSLFGAEHANVQPHSGSQANMAAYFALLEPGDTVLAMDLAQGGHLTHGQPRNMSGAFYNFVHYTVDRDSELIDLDQVRQLALRHKPKMILVGASAYPRTLDFARWRAIADEVGALLLADVAHIVGLIAAGVHPSPVGHAQVVTSTTHKTLRGPRGAFLLCDAQYAKAVDKGVFMGVQAGPSMHIIAAKAVCFAEAMTDTFREYQKAIVENAVALADAMTQRGFRLVSGGTDNHLMLVNLRERGITGKLAANALDAAGIVCNKNMIPFDERSPLMTSGIRLGTPAVTTRGMGPEQMATIADFIARVLADPKNQPLREQVRDDVREFCRAFPIYAGLGPAGSPRT